MSCWSKLYCYRFKTRMKRIALAVEGGIESECGVCSCLCSLLAQKPPSCLFSPCYIQLTKPQLSSDSLPACSSWTRLEKSPQYADQPHLKLRTIIFKRALCHTQPFCRISLVNFHPIPPEATWPLSPLITNPPFLTLTLVEKIETIAKELPLPSTTKPTTSWPLPPCALPLLPVVLASWPKCPLALRHWHLLPSPSPELSLSNHSSSFWITMLLSSFWMISFIIEIHHNTYHLKKEKKKKYLPWLLAYLLLHFCSSLKRIMGIFVYLPCLHFFSSHSPFSPTGKIVCCQIKGGQ